MRPQGFRLVSSVICVGLTLSSTATLAQSSTAQARIISPVDESQRIILHGNVHPMARPEFDRGPAPPDLPMQRMLLVLKRSSEQEFALRKLLDDQQDKASPNFHKWLTPGDFGRQFGAADSDIQCVTGWLQSEGFQVTRISKGRSVIEFSGDAGQVQEAFHTAIHKFTVNGEEHWANASDPQIPAALAPVVAGVNTLHNFLKKPQVQVAPQRIKAKLVAGVPGKPPQVTFPGTPQMYALGPADFAKIYNVTPLLADGVTGSGVTIAVVARSNLFGGAPDVLNFHSVFGLPSGNFTIVQDGPDPGDLGGGEEAEATLDATWAGAIAEASNVDLVVSASTNTSDGVDLSELYIIDNNVGQIMTESFGACEATATQAEATSLAQLAEQAAAQGITYLVSAGDSGAEGCDDPHSETTAQGPLSVNILASTPFTVAVGGTTFNENGQSSRYWNSTNSPDTFESVISYIPEDVWNESCSAAQCGAEAGIWSGGGGASVFFSKPSWQSGVTGIPSGGFRDVPDVSLTAAGHDPYLLCIEGSCIPNSQGEIEFAAVYGTSAAAPSFAGLMALVDQKSGSAQGQANYVLYRLAASATFSTCNASNTTTLPASTCVFNDVTAGNNAVPGEVGYGTGSAKYASGVGYDLATGLGSVNAENLANNWASASFKPTTTTITNLTPLTFTHGQPVNVTVTVTATGGTPTGAVSLLTSYNKSIGAFTLDSSGSFTDTIDTFPGGFYTVTASYSGDGTYAPSSSAPTAQLGVAEEQSQTTLSVLAPDQSGNLVPFTNGPYGTFLYLRGDAKAQSGHGIPTGGPNQFADNGLSLNDGIYRALNSLGSWFQIFTSFVPGGHSLTAQYNGDASFFPSNSAPVSITITPASTSTILALTHAPPGVNLTATVNTASAGNPPGGMVTFFANGTAIGQPVTLFPTWATYNSQGIVETASASAPILGVSLTNSTYNFTATYTGDTNYTSSTSPAVTGTVSPDFSLSLAAISTSLASPGDSAQDTLTVTDIGGFNAALNFTASSCSGLPPESSCSFSPASLAGSGTTTLTINTTAPHPSASRGPVISKNFLWWTSSLGLGATGIFLLDIPFRRRWPRLFLLLVVMSVITLPSCGGGSGGGGGGGGSTSDPGTPTGTYNVTVTATSGSLSHSTTFQLIVQ